MMHYSGYYPLDVVNGPGVRVSLFVSGCSHACEGCYNRSTWSFKAGQPFDLLAEERLMADLADQRVVRQGLSLSGGDPLHPRNLPSVLRLAARVRRELPDKDIWCWTGYRLEELNAEQQQLLPLLDVLIDGRFEQRLKTNRLAWRGSSNQRLLYRTEFGTQLACGLHHHSE